MDFRQTIANIYRRVFQSWVARLAARFSTLARPTIEDAINDVFTHAFERPAFRRSWQSDGANGLESLLRTAAWRAVNTHCKTCSRRSRLLSSNPPPRCDGRHPERIAAARDEQRALLALLPLAVARFGGRDPDALARALHDRFAGMSDTESAQRHGVRREQVNRARRWMCTHARR